MFDLDATPRVRLALHGEIDAATARNGISLLMDANPRPGDAVTLDLSDVDFIDSSGVSMLLEVRRTPSAAWGADSRWPTPRPQSYASSQSSA